MEAILELQNILIKDFYEDFIVSLEDEELNFNIHFSELIIYRGKEYIEKDLATIEKQIKYIIDDLKPIYIKSISEVILTLSHYSNPNDKLNYLSHIIKLLKIPIRQLKKDFYVTDFESRYYSKPIELETINSAEHITNMILRDLKPANEVVTNKKKSSYIYTNFDLFELEYSNIRMKIISRLPLTLFTIASCFINILNNKIDEIQEELQNKEVLKEKLEWSGKPSQLGFIFSKLAELDYLSPPKRDNGETNYTQFAKKLLNIFKLKTTEGTISKYLNSNEVKAQETQRNFDKANFNIPHKKEVS